MKMLGLNPMEQEIIDLTNNISRNVIMIIISIIITMMAIFMTMILKIELCAGMVSSISRSSAGTVNEDDSSMSV